MTRFLLAPALLLSAALPALAQDMPLSQILIDGEGWKKVGKTTDAEQKSLEMVKLSNGLAGISALAISPDESVIYVAIEHWTHINAFQVKGPEGARFWGQNQYCPLRIQRGKKAGGCTALATDRDGRIYAATELGVQVFDPTGRLCGVMTPAAPGKPEYMAFEGDALTLWVGTTKYARKLNTQGMK
jgi:enterochelin esterase family protein